MAAAPLTHTVGEAMKDQAVKSSKKGAEKLAAAIKGEGENPMILALGKPTFELGNGKEYAATEYRSKVPIPGRFNTTLAVAHFTIGCVTQSVSIGRQRDVVLKDGKKVNRLETRVSLPLKWAYDRKDALVVAHVNNFKAFIMDEFSKWYPTVKDQVKITKGGRTQDPSSIIEEVEADD